MVVAGREDCFALREDYYERYAALLGCRGRPRSHWIDGVGHRIEEEAPDELGVLVEEFATSTAPETAPEMGAN